MLSAHPMSNVLSSFQVNRHLYKSGRGLPFGLSMYEMRCCVLVSNSLTPKSFAQAIKIERHLIVWIGPSPAWSTFLVTFPNQPFSDRINSPAMPPITNCRFFDLLNSGSIATALIGLSNVRTWDVSLYKDRIITFPSSEQDATVSPNLSIEMSLTRPSCDLNVLHLLPEMESSTWTLPQSVPSTKNWTGV